jgi:stress responsive alpha/beta barrel protein
MLAHIVYFSLHDNSPKAVQKLLDSCNKHLSKHPGEVFYGTGTRTPDLCREVNDAEFEVALHVIFASRADHDVYQVSERHLAFIAENQANFKSVRVFDTDI